MLGRESEARIRPAGWAERFVRAICPVEQELRKEKTSESLLLHEGILSESKERSAIGHSIGRRQWDEIDERGERSVIRCDVTSSYCKASGG